MDRAWAAKAVSAAAALVLLAAAAASVGEARPGGAFTKRGTVTRVLDGDTLDVVVRGGKSERVRLLGIDSPERGDCHASAARAAARKLAQGKRVVLKGDATQDTRDRYGRLLAHVWLPGGKDLGLLLVRGGHAEAYVFRTAIRRHGVYRRAEQAARKAGRGAWGACAAKRAGVTASPACHPSYSPCLPVVGDLDCADIRAMGKDPVRVRGSDPYRLDGDGDGWGCE